MSTGPSIPGIVTPLPHYKQTNPETYCGPASAQMVLGGCFGVTPTQDDLWTEIHTGCNNGLWYSAPACLCRASNNAVASGDPFALSQQSCHEPTCETISAAGEASRDAVLNEALVAIEGGGAALTAVMCNSHWVALCGYETSGGATVAKVTKLYFQDPSTKANSGAIDCTKADWFTTYFNGGSSGRFIAIPATRTGFPSPATIEDEGDPDVDSLPPDVTRAAITAFSLERAKRSLLNRHHPLWKDSVHATTDQQFDVQRLDTDKTYLLVPIQDQQGVIRVLGRMDVATGRYRSTLFCETAIVLPKSEAEVNALLARLTIRRPDGSVWRPDVNSLRVERTLVWKPCRQSLSPFLPFHLVRSNGGDLYVRIDGAVFTQLTQPDLLGG